VVLEPGRAACGDAEGEYLRLSSATRCSGKASLWLPRGRYRDEAGGMLLAGIYIPMYTETNIIKLNFQYILDGASTEATAIGFRTSSRGQPASGQSVTVTQTTFQVFRAPTMFCTQLRR